MSTEKRFMFTGFASAPRRKLIRNVKDLGGRAVSIQDLKPNEEFILVCARPKWTEKFITACSAGLWILQSDFIEKSCSCGYWLRESSFEWCARKRDFLGSGLDDDRLLEAPHRWRIQVASGGGKAFHRWNVLILVKHRMNKEAYMRMLIFGGAVVVRKRECLSDAVWKSLTHVFVDEDFCTRHVDVVKGLIDEGFQCLSPNYIRDYVAQPNPPNVGEYFVSPDLFRKPPVLLKCLVAGLPQKTSVENSTKFDDSREKARPPSYQTRHGVRDERVREALRASVRQLLPTAIVNRQQKEQLLHEEAVVVVEGLGKNSGDTVYPADDGLNVKLREDAMVDCSVERPGGKTEGADVEVQSNVVFKNISLKGTFGASASEISCASSKDGSRVERLDAKSSLLKCDRKTQVDDFIAELRQHVSSEKISSKIGCCKETRDLRAPAARKRKLENDERKLENDGSLGCKEKKLTRLSSRTESELQPKKVNLSHSPVLREMSTEANFVVTDQRTVETRKSKKPVETLSIQPPLSNEQLLFLKEVVRMALPVTELETGRAIQDENMGSDENSGNQKENVPNLISSLHPPSVGFSRGSVIIRPLTEDIFVEDSLKNQTLSSKPSSHLMAQTVMQDVVNQECHCKEQSINSNFTPAPFLRDQDDFMHDKQSSLTTSSAKNSETSDTMMSHLVSVKLNLANHTLPSSVSSSGISTAEDLEPTTSNQPEMAGQLECMFLNPLKVKISVRKSHASSELINTEAIRNESDKFFIVRDESKGWACTKKSLPDTADRRPFSRTVTLLLDACLNADDVTGSSGRDSLKKFVDAVSSLVSPVSFPPSPTLTFLLKTLVEQKHGLDERLMHQISALLERIICLHPPISVQMKQVYVDALSHVSIQHQNFELIEYLFRKVIESSDDVVESNGGDLLLLRFIVRLVGLDFRESEKKLRRKTGEGKSRSVRWCLLTQWIWTSEFAGVRSAQFSRLIAVLLMAVRLKNHSAQMDVVDLAQKLVAMVADAWLLSSVVSTETLVPRDPWMLALVIAEQLADEKTRSADLKLFLETSACDWLSLVVCRTLLGRMDPDGVVENSCVDLRTLVKYFELHPYEAVSEDVDVRATSERSTPSNVPLTSPRPLVKRRQKLKDINKQNAKGETQLHVACRKNNVDRVVELLQTPGIDVNRADNAGWMALHEASNRGNVDVVRELLQFRPKRTINSYFTLAGPSQTIASRDGVVDVRACSHEDGITPLHDAVINGHPDVCRLLLQHAGSELLMIADKSGRTPVDYAGTEEMRSLLSEDYSTRRETVDGKPDTSKLLPSVPPSPTRGSTLTQNNAATAETTRPSRCQNSSAPPRQPISSDCSQRFCILVSNLIKFYVSWKREELTSDDHVVLTELPEHVLRLRKNLLELQNGTLLSGQVAALARLEALTDLELVMDDQIISDNEMTD